MDAMRTMLKTLKQGEVIAWRRKAHASKRATQCSNPYLPRCCNFQACADSARRPIGAEKAMPVGAKFPRRLLSDSFGPVFELEEFYTGKLDDERLKQAAW